jgi:TRAP-type mannitol/chloroaromatic compound transport system permease large subunit
MSVEFMTVAMFVSLIVAIITGHPLAYTLAGRGDPVRPDRQRLQRPRPVRHVCQQRLGRHGKLRAGGHPAVYSHGPAAGPLQGEPSKLFDALYVVLGSIKGGLGLAVVVVCTVFAATTGIIGASVVAMGLLATPALLNKGYQKEMTSGIICAAGTLGILIPPSIMMVVYGG